ncbi:keratin-associated protein 16-1-like [Gouania willdenowi]|uniref:keratin-associated protein 16-1-like n=1 Tax=Gouania willdenowi TaxID=441366 RepID=UPI001054DD0E|nr:keratin-associated protein 16-1-like [Gouania willdenowi]
MMIRILCLSVLVLLFCTDIEAKKEKTEKTEKFKKFKCFTCTEKNCKKQQYCSEGQVCMSASVIEVTHGHQNKSYYRSCTSPSYCPKSEKAETMSIGLGYQVFVATVKCCKSHLCNKKPQPHPKIPSGNGLTCLFCSNTKNPKECKVKECIGNQTHCVQVIRNGTHQSGCATKNFCHPDKILGRYKPVNGFAGALSFPAECEKAKPAPEPTTAEPTTAEPTTAEPTTAEPTIAEPTTAEPTTAEPKCVPVETTPEPTLPPCDRKG